MGDVVREEAAKRSLPPTDENIGGIGTALRKNEGRTPFQSVAFQRSGLTGEMWL